MSFTTPRTWVTDEVVTSSLLNTHVRDNLLSLRHPYHTENTEIEVISDATQVSLFTSAPTISGGDLGANGWLKAYLWCSLMMNSTSRSWTMRVKYGGTNVISQVYGPAGGAAATVYTMDLEVDLLNLGATNSQLVALRWRGFEEGVVRGQSEDHHATAAIDSTVDQGFDITVQFDASASTYSLKKLASRVQLAQA
jgi:hypothetical protein